ncbi:hypothetical protein [Bradyrhizobium yuanmingense]|uniref:hypothetical protein n=1 Tax=Bradyrhizobium yuanmingense TaxID=108015 RepID=UPI000B180199|nr:hypothetical protein [Bradyrhizobium yuanmingense]
MAIPAFRTIPLVAVAALIGLAAEARDDGRYANSPLKGWFESLKSKGGGPCCSDADGTALDDVDWETRDGSRARTECPLVGAADGGQPGPPLARFRQA